jgi:hypothetical protein
MEVDHRVGGVESEVADAQAGQLAAAGCGVIHQDHEDLVPLAGGRGRVGLLEQGLEGRLGQRLDDLAGGLLGGDGGEFEAERNLGAVEEPGVGEERPQRHEALVAGGGRATAFALQRVQAASTNPRVTFTRSRPRGELPAAAFQGNDHAHRRATCGPNNSLSAASPYDGCRAMSRTASSRRP